MAASFGGNRRLGTQFGEEAGWGLLTKLRKPFIQLHILRLSKLIYFFYKRKIFDKAGNFIDIVSKYPVLFCKANMTANKTMSKLQNLAAFKGAAKFNSLRCT